MQNECSRECGCRGCFIVRGRKMVAGKREKGNLLFFLLRSTRHPRASTKGLAWFGVGQSNVPAFLQRLERLQAR